MRHRLSVSKKVERGCFACCFLLFFVSWLSMLICLLTKSLLEQLSQRLLSQACIRCFFVDTQKAFSCRKCFRAHDQLPAKPQAVANHTAHSTHTTAATTPHYKVPSALGFLRHERGAGDGSAAVPRRVRSSLQAKYITCEQTSQETYIYTKYLYNCPSVCLSAQAVYLGKSARRDMSPTPLVGTNLIVCVRTPTFHLFSVVLVTR